MTTSGSTALGAGAIIAMGIVVAFLLLWYRFSHMLLFVIEAGEESSQSNVRNTSPSIRFLSWLQHPQEITFARILHIYQRWKQATLDKRERTNNHKELLDRLTAAYRQYHLASGGYFVPHFISRVRAQRMLAKRSECSGSACGWTSGLRHSRHILSVADIAVLWHLPQASDLAELPLLERGRARTFLVPRELATGNGC